MEEVDYYPDMQYDWKFTLGCWIDMRDRRIRVESIEAPPGRAVSYFPEFDFVSRLKPKRARSARIVPKGPVKCRFCNLRYNTVRERAEHENEWHANKLNSG